MSLPTSLPAADELPILVASWPKAGLTVVRLGGGSVGPACAPRVLSTQAVQRAVRVNVTCVTPLGEEVASTW
jgi:hypothetical protein